MRRLKPEMKRGLKRGLLTILAVVLATTVVTAGLVVAAWQYWGPHGIAIAVLQRVGISAQIRHLEISRGGWLRADGLQLHTADWDFAAAQVRATYRPAELFVGKLHLLSAAITQARVDVHPTAAHRDHPLQLMRLDVDSATVDSAKVFVAGTRVDIDHLQSALHIHDSVLSLANLQLVLRNKDAVPLAQLTGNLAFDFVVPLQMRGVLEFQRTDSTGALSISGTPAKLDATLALRTPIAHRFNLQVLQAPDQIWHLLAEATNLPLARVTLATAHANLTLHGAQMPLTIAATYPESHVGLISLALAGTTDLRTAHFQGQLSAARTPLQVTVDTWLSPWRVAADFSGDHVDLAHFVAATPSRLSVHGHLDAVGGESSGAGSGASASIEINANGLLLARQVTAMVKARISDAGAQLLHATLNSPGNHLDAAGDWQHGLHINADLNHLEQLSGVLAGHIRGAGSISQRDYHVDLHGAGLRIGTTLRAGHLDASGQGDFGGRIGLTLSGDQISFAGQTVTRLNGRIQGSGQSHLATLDLRSDLGTLNLGVRGALTNDLWRGQLTKLSATLTHGGIWTNQLSGQSPAQISARRDAFALDALCVVNSAANSACVRNVRYANGQLFGVLRAHGLPLAMLPLPSVAATRLLGAIDIDATANGAGADVAANIAKGTFTGGRAPLAFAARATGHLPLLTGEPWRIDAQVNGAAFGQVAASGTRAVDGRIAGRVHATVPEIAALQALLIPTDQWLLRGAANLDVTISGRDSAPQFSGGGTLRGALVARAFSRTEFPLILNAQGQGGALSIHSTLTAGDGKVQGDGQLQLSSTHAPQLTMHFTGEHARLLNQNDLSALFAPDITLILLEQRITLTGRALVEQADIRFDTVQNGNAGLSSDVVIHRAGDVESTAGRAPTLPLDADLRITLGDHVNFIAAGLKTRLVGALQFRSNPGRTFLLGHVDAADGTFTAYGVTLTIERGRMDFNGPIDTPQVNVRAVRKLEDSKDRVGVIVSGPLQRLNTQLFSEPPRTPAETLGYLITGKPLDVASQGDLAKVNGAGIALGVVGLLPVTSTLRDRLGLDELAIRNPLDQNSSAVTVGKNITNRLRARYSYSVFNRTGGLQLRYQVTDNISLQTEAGAQTKAVDILWEWHSKAPASK